MGSKTEGHIYNIPWNTFDNDCNPVLLTVMWHCIKSDRIQSYSGPYSVRKRENTDKNNSEYGHFSRKMSDNFKDSF